MPGEPLKSSLHLDDELSSRNREQQGTFMTASASFPPPSGETRREPETTRNVAGQRWLRQPTSPSSLAPASARVKRSVRAAFADEYGIAEMLNDSHKTNDNGCALTVAEGSGSGRGGHALVVSGRGPPPPLVTSTALQRSGFGAMARELQPDNSKVSVWPSSGSQMLPPLGTRREMVAKAPLALQVEAFIRKEHRQYLLDHPGCAKFETLHIFREAFRALAEHFCEYRSVLTLIQDEYEASLTDVLEQVKRMRIIDLENKSDRSLHAMELAAVKESLNTTISNQRAELQSAQGLVHALREQLATAEKVNEDLRREVRRNNLEHIHALEQVKMFSNTIIEEAGRSAAMLVTMKKKDKDIELLNSCVKVLREEVEELNTSLLEQLRVAMTYRAGTGAPPITIPAQSSKSSKVLRDVDEAAKLTRKSKSQSGNGDKNDEAEEEEGGGGVSVKKMYPEEYVGKLLQQMDELSLEVEKWKSKATECTPRIAMVEHRGAGLSSVVRVVEEGKSGSLSGSGDGNNSTSPQHDSSFGGEGSPDGPLPTTSILTSRSNATRGQSSTLPSGRGPSSERVTAAPSENEGEESLTVDTNVFTNTNPDAEGGTFSASQFSGTGGSPNVFNSRFRHQSRFISQSFMSTLNPRATERQTVLSEFPIIQSWLREEGIGEQELEVLDTLLPTGHWHGMDMSFLSVTKPVKNLHLNLESVRQLLDRIWTERESRLSYTRLRTYFLQWLEKETGDEESGRVLGVNMIHVCQHNYHDADCYVFIHALRGFLPEDVALTWRKGIRHLRRTCEQNTNYTLEEEQLVHQKVLFEALRAFFPEKPLENVLQLRFCFFRASGGADEVRWPDFLRDDSLFIHFIKKQTIREIEEFTLRVVETIHAAAESKEYIPVKKVAEIIQLCDPALPDYVVRKLTADGCLKSIRDVAIADDSMTVLLNVVLSRFRSSVMLRRVSIPSKEEVTLVSPKKKPWE